MNAVVFSVLILISSVSQILVDVCASQDFDFFYFVQQWPGSYCDTKRSCCYPTSGKPAKDFGIHGLWPQFNDGSYPSDCDSDASFDPLTVRSLKMMHGRKHPNYDEAEAEADVSRTNIVKRDFHSSQISWSSP